MKYLNIIKLLTVLLCIGMLFVACDSTAAEAETTEEETTIVTEAPTEEPTETPTEVPTEEPETEEPLLGNVEGKFENFFEELEAESGKLTTAERVEGDIAKENGDIIVFRDAQIDAKNVVIETYKVYNTETGEFVLTVTNEYFNISCEEFDFFADDFRVFENTVLVENADKTFSPVTQREKTYRESYLTVEIIEDAWFADLILVAKAEVTPIDGEVREENPEGCVYKVETTYSYYDVYGTLVAESNAPLSINPYSIFMGSDVFAVELGSEVLYFDLESGKVIKTSGLESAISGIYEYENDRYGYYEVNNTYILDGEVSFMDIVHKRSGEVRRYHFDNGYEDFDVFYLHNGDLLVQYLSEVDESEPYDYYSCNGADFTFYSIKTVIFSVDDGKETVIEKPEFYIQTLIAGDYYNELMEYYGDGVVNATENARNIAVVYTIKDGVIGNTDDLVVFDNDLTVLYTYERILEQQVLFDDSSVLGYKTLANGDRLVSIGGEELPYAIVAPDGTVRAYLKAGMTVIGDYVSDGKVLYDYDLNAICNYADKGYSVIELFGECVFVSSYEGRYMTFEVYGENVYLDDLFEDEVTLVEYNDDYAVFYNLNTGKYTLYNESMEAILASGGNIDVYSVEDGGYLVVTYAGADRTCYVLK